MARVLSGQFEEGHAVLAEIEQKDGDRAAEGIRSYFFEKLTQQSDEVDFLKLVMGQIEDLPDKIDTKTSNLVAERLLAMGFAQQAGSVLRGGASGETGRDRRLLRSRIALAEHRPRNAEAELLGLTGEDVDLLRARTRQLSGDHDIAHTLFSSLDKVPDAERAAWLASDWGALSKSSDPTYAAIATMARTTNEAPATTATERETEERVLARNRSLLQESVASREVIASVLAKHEVTVALEN